MIEKKYRYKAIYRTGALNGVRALNTPAQNTVRFPKNKKENVPTFTAGNMWLVGKDFL